MKLKNEVINIFKNLSEKEFTVRQALDSYMASPEKVHTDLKIARQFVHRNILKLVETGEVVKTNKKGRSHKYSMVDQCNKNNIKLMTIPTVSNADVFERKLSIKESLTERLHQQKLQLLTAMGEAEEYDAIYKEMPEIQKQIQSLYNESRDKCSKLLGKVKAIENLISLSSK